MTALLLDPRTPARRRRRSLLLARQQAAHERGAEGDLARRAGPDRRLAGPERRRARATPTRSAQPARWRCAPRRSRGSWTPVQEKLGRMESEISRLERERRQAQGELAPDGAPARRRASARCARRPATSSRRSSARPRVAPGVRSSCETWSRWRAWSRTATSSSRARSSTGEGALRPDMLVRLPGGKLVVVDSKVPLDAYLSALEAEEDGEQREIHIARHACQTREHIVKLAAKGYQRAARRDAGVRRHVRALRWHLPGRARRRTRR